MTNRVAYLLGIAVTALSATAMVAADANAQERNRRNRGNAEAAAAAPASPTVSRPFAAAYQPVNTAIQASDLATAEAGMEALRAAATTPYELFLVSQTAFRIASAQRDPAKQLVALEGMIISGGIPDAQRVPSLVAAGQLAYNTRDYAKAAQRIGEAMAAGATTAGLDLLRIDALSRAGMATEGLAYGAARVAELRAAGQMPSDEFYGTYARLMQETDNEPGLASVLVERASAYPTAVNFRSASTAILRVAGDARSQATDLLRLVFAADAMNDRRFYLEYVANVAEDGLPNEALRVIAAGERAGVIPAGDSTFGEIAASQRVKLADDRSSLAGTERRAIASPDARLAQVVADAYFSYDDFAKAEQLYTLALTKNGADADLLNTRIGMVRLAAGNAPGAIEAFDRVTTGTRGNIARLWTAFARTRVAAETPAPEAAAPAS